MLSACFRSRFGAMKGLLEEKLKMGLNPQYLEVVNESHRHSRGTETHYNIVVVSERFEGLPKIKKHQLVHETLGELVPKVHALTLTCRTPLEMTELEHNKSPGCMHSKKS